MVSKISGRSSRNGKQEFPYHDWSSANLYDEIENSKKFHNDWSKGYKSKLKNLDTQQDDDMLKGTVSSDFKGDIIILLVALFIFVVLFVLSIL